MMVFRQTIVVWAIFIPAFEGFTVNKASLFGPSPNEGFLAIEREFNDFFGRLNLSRDQKQDLGDFWVNISQVFKSAWDQNVGNFKYFERLKPDPDAKRNSSELITSKGLLAEEHHVTTADGYILLIVRIKSPKVKRKLNQPPVFLLHGLLSSSDCFINNLRNESLGFILADLGFDVWLGNIRGNRYTTKHEHLQPTDGKFWKWSFDEMGKYDVPVMVNYVLSQTGHKKLDFVGHSEGTTNLITSVIGNGKRMADRINKFIALAPAVYVSHSKGLLRVLAKFANIIQRIWDPIGKGDVFSHKGFVAKFSEKYCYDIPAICSIVLHSMVGTGLHHFNMSRVPVYLSHSPAGTSTRNMIHWSQQCQGGNDLFYYDYGSKIANYIHYRQFSPPKYDMKKFTVPTYSFLGDLDWLVTPPDGRAIIRDLPNLKWTKIYPDFNHIDFVWGFNIVKTVVRDIIEILENY